MGTRTSWLFALLCFCWGIPYFFIKLALVDFSPVWVAWGRITLGALMLLPIAWHRGTLLPALRHKAAILAFAVLELVIPFWLIAAAERTLSSSLVGVLIATVPLTVVAMAPLFGIHEALSARRLIGLIIGFAGVLVLLGFETVSGTAQWLAVACIAIAIVGYAAAPLVVQRYLVGVDELGAVAVSLGFASVALLPACVTSMPHAAPSALALGSIATLGFVSTGSALLLYFYVIHAAGAARASVVAYISPAIAVVLGVVVLHEHFGIGSAAGLVFIVVGSALGSSGAEQNTAAESLP